MIMANYYYAVYDGNTELVNYFDTLDDALVYVLWLDPDGAKDYTVKKVKEGEPMYDNR